MDLVFCYMFLAAFETLICIFSWPPIIWIVRNLFRHKATHINFRILLSYTILEYQLITTLRIIARSLRGLDNRTFFWPIIICNVGQHWFLNQCVFSTLLLTIERTISTVWSKYERCGPLFSIGTIVLIATGMLYITISLEITKNSLPSACKICSIAEAQPETLIYGWLMGLCPMLINGFILFKLHKYNTKGRQDLSNTLHKKFQFVENIYTTKCLVPISLFYAATCTLVLPLDFYTMQYTSIYGAFDVRIKLSVLSVLVFFDVFCYLIIFCIIRNFPPIKARLNSDLRTWGLFRSRITADQYVDPNEHRQATQSYFNQLELAWR